MRIETDKYFRYLINMITNSGGSLELGTTLTKEGVEKIKKTQHVVNCLGNNAGKIGGGEGEYYSNPGEVVIWKRCPKNFDFYIMDDDMDAGVMQMPDGRTCDFTIFLKTSIIKFVKSNVDKQGPRNRVGNCPPTFWTPIY